MSCQWPLSGSCCLLVRRPLRHLLLRPGLRVSTACSDSPAERWPEHRHKPDTSLSLRWPGSCHGTGNITVSKVGGAFFAYKYHIVIYLHILAYTCIYLHIFAYFQNLHISATYASEPQRLFRDFHQVARFITRTIHTDEAGESPRCAIHSKILI